MLHSCFCLYTVCSSLYCTSVLLLTLLLLMPFLISLLRSPVPHPFTSVLFLLRPVFCLCLRLFEFQSFLCFNYHSTLVFTFLKHSILFSYSLSIYLLLSYFYSYLPNLYFLVYFWISTYFYLFPSTRSRFLPIQYVSFPSF